jgi:hypothetical protein
MVDVETACAHCGQELHFTLDSDLKWSAKDPDAHPLLFEPEVDWKHFEKPNIIGDY